MDSLGSRELAEKVTVQAIPQVCAYANRCLDQTMFWRMFFSGMAGAAAAAIGHEALIRVLQEITSSAELHAERINQKTH